MRLLSADATSASRAAARAMLPSSHTATKCCSEMGSMGRVIRSGLERNA
jgi:hypothetical protein